MCTAAVNHTKWCIYLSMVVNDSLYKKNCKSCHDLLKKYCAKLAAKEIIKKNKKQSSIVKLKIVPSKRETTTTS